MRRFLRRLGLSLAILAAALLALVTVGAYLLTTPLGGGLARRAAESGVSSLIAGRLELGEVEIVGFGELRARDARLFDPDGREVITAAELSLSVELSALLKREISLPKVTFKGVELVLAEGADGLPSFLDALASPDPPSDDPSPFTARAPRVSIEDLSVRGELLGVRDVRLEGGSLEGSLEYVDDELTLRIDTYEGLLTGPVKRPLPLRGERVVVGTDAAVGSRLAITLGDAEEWVSAEVSYALPSPGAAEEVLSVDVELHEVRAESLAELGLGGADALTGAVSGRGSARGPVDSLVVEGALSHAAGELTIEGEIGEESVVRVRSERLAAKQLVPAAPDVAPSVDATLRLSEGRAPQVELELSAMEIEGLGVPPTRSTLSLEEDRVDVAVHSTSPGRIAVEGSVHHDGELDLRVSARLASVAESRELRALAPGLAGGASLDARVRGTLDDPRIRGGFVIAPFAYGPVQAARLSVSGDVTRLADAPSLAIDVRVARPRLWDRPVDDVALTVRGRRGALAATGRVGQEGTIDARFDLDDTFHLHRGVVRAEGFIFDARDVEVSERETRLGSVHIQRGRARLALSGTLRERGEDSLQLDVADLPLADVRLFVDLPFEALSGEMTFHAELEGDLESDPSIYVQGALEDIRGGGLEGAFASIYYKHTGGHSLAQVQFELGEGGSAAVGLNAYVDLSRQDLLEALEEAYFDLSVDVIGFDLGLAQPILPETLGEVRGQADGSLRFSGLLDALEIDGRVETRNMRAFGLPEMTYVLTAQRRYGSLTLDLAASDASGLIAEVGASTVGNALAMIREPERAAEALALAPWLVHARAPTRRIRDLPAPIVQELPEAVGDAHLAVSLEAQGGSLEPRVELRGVLLYPADEGALCGGARSVSLPFTLLVREKEAQAEGELLFDSRVAGRLRARAEPELARWLERGAIERTPIEATLAMENARLGNLPVICEFATGEITGELRLVDFMGETPRAVAYLESNSVRLRAESTTVPGASRYETPPLKLGLTLGVDAEQTNLDLTLRAGLDSRVRVDGTAPLTLTPHGTASFDEEAPFSVFFDLERAPLAVLLGFTPELANVEGIADGWGRIGGTLEAPDHHAELSIERGRLTITSLGQRLADVEGVATLDPGRLQLKHFRARDGDGRVTARGHLDIEALRPVHAELDISLEGFPIRDEGTVVAALRGRGELDTRFSTGRADGTLVLHDLHVEMPGLGGPSLQELADHPDVRLSTELATEEKEDDSSFAISLHIDATEPFDVKGPDFNATLTADLRVHVQGDSLRIGGNVDLRGGRFSVLGKPFDVTSGSLRFDPRDESLSPAVSLEAVYLVDGDRSKRVTVSVGGTLSEPTVRFASNVPTNNEGEIIALIVTGETHAETERGFDSAAAGRDAADFVAGVAFGVVSLSLREEFGGFLPVVTLEGQNRFRARFDAERFLPESVRKIVRRVRIEGYFTAGQAGEEGQVRQSGQAQTAGFSIELGFPRGIVGRGTVAPPNNWSTQVLWEP